jgi:hypothetical protein
MRCPKCGFISFDFNQVCPKCNKELYNEQIKLNLPTFKPDPPQMLGSLIGADFDSDVEEKEVRPYIHEADHNIGAVMEDTLTGFEEDKFSYENEEELDVLGIEPEVSSLGGEALGEDVDLELVEPEAADVEAIPEPEPSYLDLAPDKSVEVYDNLHEPSPSPAPGESEAPEVFLDLDSLELEEPTMGEAQKAEPDFAFEIDEDALSFEPVEQAPAEETKGVKDDIKQEDKGEIKEDDISFSLDDISFDDLEIEGSDSSELEWDFSDKDPSLRPDDVPVTEVESFKDSGTMEAFYYQKDAEGLTREIKKPRKNEQK